MIHSVIITITVITDVMARHSNSCSMLVRTVCLTIKKMFSENTIFTPSFTYTLAVS